MENSGKKDALATATDTRPISGTPSPSSLSPPIEAVLEEAVKDGIPSGTISALVLHMNADTAVAYGRAAEEKTKQEIEKTNQAKEITRQLEERTKQDKEVTNQRRMTGYVQLASIPAATLMAMSGHMSVTVAVIFAAIFGYDLLKEGGKGLLKLMAQRTKALPPAQPAEDSDKDE